MKTHLCSKESYIRDDKHFYACDFKNETKCGYYEQLDDPLKELWEECNTMRCRYRPPGHRICTNEEVTKDVEIERALEEL